MSHTNTILKSFRKHQKTIIYEKEGNGNKKVLTKNDKFFSDTTNNLVDLTDTVTIAFNNMEINRGNSFYWSGTIDNDIKWIFSVGGNEANGLFLTMDVQKINEKVFEDLRKIVTFFNGQFNKEITKKLFNNSF